jgi:hypothetical protein
MTTVPCVSARTCVSTWRGRSRVPLHEALAAAEGCGGLADGTLEQLGHLLGGPRDLQAASAAAEGGLDGHGVPVVLGEGGDLLDARDRVRGARRQGRADGEGDVACRGLVAESADGVGGRPDPGQAGGRDGFGEIGVLGEEPVPGVHRVRPGFRRGIENLVDA